MITFGQAGSFG
jgi:hypothetical protein